MKDLGTTPKRESLARPMKVPGKSYPSLHLYGTEAEKFPAIAPGQTVKATVELRGTSETITNGKRTEVGVEVRKIGPMQHQGMARKLKQEKVRRIRETMA